MRLVLIAFLTSLIAACSPSSVVEKLLSPQERRLVEQALADIDRGDAEQLSRKMPPEYKAEIQGALPAMRDALPSPPRELTLLKANVSNSGGVRTVEATWQVKGGSRWAVLDAVLTTESGRAELAGLHIQQTAAEPMALNGFRLEDAGAAGWSMIVAMIAAVGVTIAAVVRIWRSGLFERRWIWTVGALVGLTTLRMNWGTGELSFQPISFQILSASAMKTLPFGSWVLGVSIPVVALIALFKRREDTAVEAGA